MPKTSLFIHHSEVDNFFQLLGDDENDISYGLGFTLSKSKHFLKIFVKNIFNKKLKFYDNKIWLQNYGKDKGYTDFEIKIDDKFFCIIEAKKGWNLPSNKQLKRYSSRFRENKHCKRFFLVISECSEEYADYELPLTLYKTPIEFTSWKSIFSLIDESHVEGNNKEKQLLSDFKSYLSEVISMKDINSNRVYCVSLASGKPRWSDISWKDIVYKKHRYFFPVGRGWPNNPPNYMAFRYHGHLQSIHHVEDYEIVTNLHKYIKEIKRRKCDQHYLLKLGPAFEPRREIPNGNIWSNGRFWCALDALFTSKSIKEAIKITKKRKEE